MAKRPPFFCSTSRCSRQWKNVELKPTDKINCLVCGRPMTMLRRVKLGIATTILVTPDVPEHFNMSLNQRVRSRRHLRDLRKIHGTQDYEGVNGANLRQVFGPGGELRSVSR